MDEIKFLTQILRDQIFMNKDIERRIEGLTKSIGNLTESIQNIADTLDFRLTNIDENTGMIHMAECERNEKYLDEIARSLNDIANK